MLKRLRFSAFLKQGIIHTYTFATRIVFLSSSILSFLHYIPSTLSPHIYSILYTYLFSLKYPFHPLYFVVDANQIVLALMLHRITLREMLCQSFKCNWFYHRIIFIRQNILVYVAALYKCILQNNKWNIYLENLRPKLSRSYLIPNHRPN